MDSKKSNNIKVQKMAIMGIMSALVFALSSISLPVGGVSRLHFGNIMCLLAGLILGPLPGGIAAGLGSMLYDFTNPLYISEFWITFINKFAMGFIAGFLNKKLANYISNKIRPLVSAFAGSVVYIVLYIIKNAIVEHYVKGVAWGPLVPILGGKILVSLLNGILAVIASVILYRVLNPAIKKIQHN